MSIRAIDHIDWAVRDVAASREFYEKMGFNCVLQTTHNGCAAEMQPPAKATDGAERNEFRTILELHTILVERNPEIIHIAFLCDDVQETWAELKEKGIVFDEDPWLVKETGRTLANFRTPDGRRVQLVDMARGDAEETGGAGEGSDSTQSTLKAGVCAVDHIELIIRNVEEYIEFFEKLGFKCVLKSQHHGCSVEMQLPETTPDGKDNGKIRTIFELHEMEKYENPEINHIAFLVDNVHESVAEMKKKGITFEQEPFFMKETGRTIANFRSPDGQRLQLVDAARKQAE